MFSPQLLCEIVIDCCAEFEDPSTLLVCSFICRSWARRSRQHYFKTTHISSAAQARSFLPLISDPMSFIKFSEIQALVLGKDQGCVHDWCWHWLPVLLEVLPSVKALTFSMADHEIHSAFEVHSMPSGRDEGVFVAPISLVPASLRMTTLKLVGCHFFSLRQLFLVLSQFTLLEDLTLERLRFKNLEPDTFVSNIGVYKYVQHLVYLKRLRVDFFALKSSRSEVSSYVAFMMPSVEMLSLRMPRTKDEWLMMQQLLHGLRGSLVELEWRECGDMRGDWNNINLGLNVFRVRAICFSGIRQQWLDRSGIPPKSMIPLILYQVYEGHDLRNVIFNVQDPDVVVAMNGFLCRAIDKALERRAFSKLKQLVIRVKEQRIGMTRALPMQYRAWIQSAFPLAYGKGIGLKVE
ncbi:hypothetical protein IW261DRAFT_1034370 [Armillaria novae-zelandiae]|uniref:Uncharacterized protein n=1 Tax=Armillaria novae-zelandiae TaxID=153914 RepID=A0AA39PE98_9AGAR|nr:hypothetical protein IW261DRAFT_1034370 [Armillaria novae-zelandiae]